MQKCSSAWRSGSRKPVRTRCRFSSVPAHPSCWCGLFSFSGLSCLFGLSGLSGSWHSGQNQRDRLATRHSPVPLPPLPRRHGVQAGACVRTSTPSRAYLVWAFCTERRGRRASLLGQPLQRIWIRLREFGQWITILDPGQLTSTQTHFASQR